MIWTFLLALAACGSDTSPIVARGSDAPAVVARATDAGNDAGTSPDARPRCTSSESPLAFAEITVPAGWCWVRTEEGDDQSGVLVDETGTQRMRYFMLAHGARVADPCSKRKARTEHVHGIAFRVCEVEASRTCFSFAGRANLCTEPAMTGDAALALVRGIRPKQR